MTQQRTKECSCNGTNEHCFKCGGRGFIGEDAALTDGVAVLKEQFVCSMCAVRFEDTALLAKHVIDLHSTAQRQLPPPRSDPITERDVAVSCLRCGSRQWAKQLDRHLKDEHGIPSFIDNLSATQRGQGFVFCDLCRVPVKRKNVDKHLLKVHPRWFDSDWAQWRAKAGTGQN
jgi:hypothetical protein